MAGHKEGMLVHNKCFVKGTEVLLKDGTWKAIEDINLDDVLLGENGFENKVKDFHRPVLGLNDHILPHNLRLASINGSEFAVSEDHMIKTTTGWKTPTVEMCKILHAETLKNERINIEQLGIGDEIICSDGSLVVVESIEFKNDSPDLQLYNFRLHGNKTYHVRMKGTDKFILVHNKDPLAQTFVVNKDDGSDVLTMLQELRQQLENDQTNDDNTFNAKDGEYTDHINKLSAEIDELVATNRCFRI